MNKSLPFARRMEKVEKVFEQQNLFNKVVIARSSKKRVGESSILMINVNVLIEGFPSKIKDFCGF